jgi:hypothetical protein
MLLFIDTEIRPRELLEQLRIGVLLGDQRLEVLDRHLGPSFQHI